MRFSFGYDLTDTVRAAILETPEDAWVPALDQDGTDRENGEVVEITDRLELSCWPEDSRLIVRREPRTPARSCRSPTMTATASRRPSPTSPTRTSLSWSAAIASAPESRTGSATTRDTGLAKFPFKEFALNDVWLEIVMLAHDLIVWTQTLLLDAELANAEPNGCDTGCCTSPPGSRSPDGAANCTSARLALDRSAQSRVRETHRAARRSRLNPGRRAPAIRADRAPAAIAATKKQGRTDGGASRSRGRCP
jgi:hypothetical protein